MFTSAEHGRHDGQIERGGRRDTRRHRWTPSARKDALGRAAAESVPVHILVAEDDDDMRRLVVAALGEEGFDVVDVRSGGALLDYMESCTLEARGEPPIDLIISDVRMHGGTGLEILAGLRQTDWSTPVILITAFGDAKLHAEARRLGALAVFDKPFDLRDLRRLARTVVKS